ncbi:MAG: 1,4-dihydroxy-2-naphthoyl-CoA hydrolase [Deltaproteobacteria bacterium ADurb.Bin151]|jgi:acyl-CoA thioester hydrolase|nr:MAG: 1,4-dihydroxy-2-naphthoyl-CoA hydrolase [Deltaproteobacteria bacterium ADurb.Bin151]HNZ10393.1 thioesterase family protein [Smithellaceae bacterium]HOG81237.1 thioesterase family protein [Smithellaceae bacterium]HOQ41162.1 thioesterase family protein [Smithellaceae bacterium]HPL65496.1 thioesterase family protein [Smithellaceae bacterium]
MSADKKSFEVKISVPFFDLDPMQIVWHGNYLNYFEIARAALFEHYGVDLYSYYDREKIIFPIIRTSTKHIFPLRHRDEIICKATLADANIKLVVDFEIRKTADNSVCARGRTEQVAVKTPEMETLFSIPQDIRELLGY